LEKNPGLEVKLVDGSSLAVAVVLNSIPKGTSQVVFRGRLSKVAYSIVSMLCHKDIQVVVIRKDEYEKLKSNLSSKFCSNLVLYGTSDNGDHKASKNPPPKKKHRYTCRSTNLSHGICFAPVVL